MGFDEALLYIDKHLTVSGSDSWSCLNVSLTLHYSDENLVNILISL